MGQRLKQAMKPSPGANTQAVAIPQYSPIVPTVPLVFDHSQMIVEEPAGLDIVLASNLKTNIDAHNQELLGPIITELETVLHTQEGDTSLKAVAAMLSHPEAAEAGQQMTSDFQ